MWSSKIGGAVATAKGEESGNFGMTRGFDEGVEARRSGTGEIAFGAGKLDGSEFVAETAQFGEARSDVELLRGGSGSEDRDLRTFAEGLGLARGSWGRGHAWGPSKGISSVTTPWRLSWATIWSSWLWVTSASNSTTEFAPAIEVRNWRVGTRKFAEEALHFRGDVLRMTGGEAKQNGACI